MTGDLPAQKASKAENRKALKFVGYLDNSVAEDPA